MSSITHFSINRKIWKIEFLVLHEFFSWLSEIHQKTSDKKSYLLISKA
jgi:hypothetical protein